MFSLTCGPELTKRPFDTHRQTKPERAGRIIEIDQMVTGFWRLGARERGLTALPLSLPDPSMRFLAEFRGLHVLAFSIRPLMRIRRPFR